MNTYQYNGLKVNVFDDSAFEPNSLDNSDDYSARYFGNDGELQPNSRHGIRVYSGEEVVGSCVLLASGGATTVHSHSSLLSNNRLLVCCGDTIFCLRIPDLRLDWQVKIDTAACFQVYSLDEDYLIHGEVDISRVDKDGNIKWSFSGSDIFVSPGGTNEFRLLDNVILLNDFSGNSYRLDLNGKVL